MLELDGCPLDAIPAEVFEVAELADLWRKGLPPVAGGALDQAAVFVEAARAWWAECTRLRRSSGQLTD